MSNLFYEEGYVCPECGLSEMTHCICNDNYIGEQEFKEFCGDSKCSVCKINPVDSFNGFDACSECLNEI